MFTIFLLVKETNDFKKVECDSKKSLSRKFIQFSYEIRIGKPVRIFPFNKLFTQTRTFFLPTNRYVIESRFLKASGDYKT